MSKDSIVVLTHMAWAAIVVSAHKVSQDLQLRYGITVPRFKHNIINVLVAAGGNIKIIKV